MGAVDVLLAFTPNTKLRSQNHSLQRSARVPRATKRHTGIRDPTTTYISKLSASLQRKNDKKRNRETHTAHKASPSPYSAASSSNSPPGHPQTPSETDTSCPPGTHSPSDNTRPPPSQTVPPAPQCAPSSDAPGTAPRSPPGTHYSAGPPGRYRRSSLRARRSRTRWRCSCRRGRCCARWMCRSSWWRWGWGRRGSRRRSGRARGRGRWGSSTRLCRRGSPRGRRWRRSGIRGIRGRRWGVGVG